MKISDLIAMCLRNLLRRKFRTFLTVTGVVIGTCAIVVMISLGVGMSIGQEEWLNSIGDLSVIEVYSRGGGQESVLDDAAVAAIQAMPGVDIATPFMNYYPPEGRMELFAGKKERYASWTSITGVYPEALEKLGYELAEGAEIPKPGGKTMQLIFGPKAAYEFYNVKNGSSVDSWGMDAGELPDPFFDPVTTEFIIKLSGYGEDNKTLKYTAGVSAFLKSGSRSYESQYGIYMHIDDLKRIKQEYEKANNIKRDKKEKDQYENVKVKVEVLDNVSGIQAAIEEMGFGAWSMEAMRQQMQEQARQTQLILGILGGVSLFVAAISITNTMIMSVYERTREIGVMKVLGCLVGDIRKVFLMEAGLIGFIGGVVGIAVSYLLSWLLNTFGGMLGNILGGMPMGDGSKLSIIPPWLVLLGLIFATFIGLFSGFQPANRAVKISALEAIKSE